MLERCSEGIVQCGREIRIDGQCQRPISVTNRTEPQSDIACNPNGPIMEVCRKNRWDFMIVLQDKSLPSVWEEYEGLKKLETDNRF